MFDVAPMTIRNIAKDLGIEGEEASFGRGQQGIGYDPWQVNQIRDELIRRGYIKEAEEE